MNDRRKDNLTDVASQISNQPQQPQKSSSLSPLSCIQLKFPLTLQKLLL
ncbi:MAG TPA: hypothetical protein VE090_02290 [Methylomirabilota bacterium]|nr:hypothetical protein [Methylomirabilota bacterium]